MYSTFSGATILGCRYINTQKFENQCLIEYPKVVVSGKVHHTSGLFSPGSDRYYLYYKGKTREAQKECKARIAVTKSEYERKMYGEN